MNRNLVNSYSPLKMLCIVAGIIIGTVMSGCQPVTPPPVVSPQEVAEEVVAAKPEDDQTGAVAEAYAVDIDPTDFVDVVDNPYFPLIPGSRYVYEGIKEEGTERVEIEILSEKREIMGVSATVMRSTAYLEGDLVEDTNIWYAQDSEGNVWYFGEGVKAYEDGELVDTEGSWEAGVDGALPGIIMLNDPAAHIGETYRLEYDLGQAEDMAQLLSANASVSVPYGEFDHAVQTLDYTPLEPEAQEHKFYVEGIGLVRTVGLGSGEENYLVEFTEP